MAISKRLRFEILRRDNFRCRYCGATPEQSQLRVDHVVPVTLGGTDSPNNLVTACEPCNTGRTSVVLTGPIVESVSDDALRWANALKEAAAQRFIEYQRNEDQRQHFLTCWNSWTIRKGIKDLAAPLPGDWAFSLELFYAAGLEQFDIAELIDVAMGGPAGFDGIWKYFCGCAWTRIKESHNIAHEIIGQQKQITPSQQVDRPETEPMSVGQLLQELSNRA